MTSFTSSHNQKLQNLPNSIFPIMSKLAAEHSAINLSQGFPDFDTDPILIELVPDAMRYGYNQHALIAGIYSLRKLF